MCPSYTKKSMDQLIIDYGTHLVTRPRFIHDFVILLGQNIVRSHVTIRVPINYRWRYWTFTINYFLEHEWYLCPLTAVAYMSVTTFICDDYTTCLKIINCITQVMIILGPCRNNWITNFRQERPSLLFLVHTQNANCSRQMQNCTQFPQKQNNK